MVLVVLVALPHVYASDCYLTSLQVTDPGIVNASQDFVLLVQFTPRCPNYYPAGYIVTVIDGDNGKALSVVNTTSPVTYVHVTARNASGGWYLTVQISTLGASTWGTVGFGFAIHVNPRVPVQPVGNFTEPPPCHHGKQC
jgi:hypothetical protein